MLLWLTFAALAALVGWLIMRVPPVTAADTAAGDMAVYRDQLAELEADAARGLIPASEADGARTEVARRMIKAAEEATARRPTSAAPSPAISAPRILTISAAAIPLLGLALYLQLGAPELPARPLSARLATPIDDRGNSAAANDIMAKIEAHLRDHPEDGRGWSVIAPAYFSQGRPLEAAAAYERAIALAGENVERLAGLAKSNLVLGNGIVNDIARNAYERALKLDPGFPEARFWLAISQEQNGRVAQAIEALRKLAAEADPTSPWRGAAEERIKALTGGDTSAPPGAPATAQAAPPPPASASPGPLRKDPSPSEFVAAAQQLAPEMREAMIGGRMIPKAQDAVKQNPKDFSAWRRIVTGHMALGHTAEALSALEDARRAAAGDESALSGLDKLAAELGLKS